MTVFIVEKNGKIDEVFDNLTAARHHRDMLTRKWNLTSIIEREVKSL